MAGADFAESARCPNRASRGSVSQTQTDEDRQVLIPVSSSCSPSHTLVAGLRHQDELSFDAELSGISCARRASVSGRRCATTGWMSPRRSSSSRAPKSSRNHPGSRGSPPTGSDRDLPAYRERLAAVVAESVDPVGGNAPARIGQAPQPDQGGGHVPHRPASLAPASVRDRGGVAVHDEPSAGAGLAGTVRTIRLPAQAGNCPGPAPRPSWLADRGPAAASPVGSAPNGTTRPGTRSSSHVAHAVRLHHRGCGHNHLLTGGSGPFLVAATCRGARICEPAGAPDAMRPTVTSHGYGHLAQRVLTGRQISQRLPASARSRCLRSDLV